MSKKSKAAQAAKTAEQERALQQLLFGGTSADTSGHRSAESAVGGDDSGSQGRDQWGEESDEGSGEDSEGEADNEASERRNSLDSSVGSVLAAGTAPSATSASSAQSASKSQQQNNAKKRKPAWQDDEDPELQVDLTAGASRLRKLRKHEQDAVVSGAEFERRLRAQFQKLAPPAGWAKPAASAGAAKGKNVDFLRDSSSILAAAGGSTPTRLPRGILKVRRVKDANVAEPSHAVVQSVQWHPNSSVLMTAGMDKKVRLFQLDGKTNRKIQSFHLDDLPIRTAAISQDGTQILCSGRRRFFYSIDLMSGKTKRVPRLHGCNDKSLEHFVLSPDGKHICFLGNDGYLILASAKSHRYICSMKMNGTVRAAAFTPDSKEILSVGSQGEVYRWDLRQQRCLQRFQDEGNLGGTALAVAPTGSLFAVGSTSGVVNVYDAAKSFGAAGSSPEPEKAIMNLTTAADFVEFNHDASMLCIASRKKKDALRMVHMDSLTTFSNWPTSNTPLHYVNAVAFSPHSGYLGIGNDKGAVLTYRLNQFTNA